MSQNLLAEEPDGFTPLTDIGIRLGWDDEQILIWQSRQVAPTRRCRSSAAWRNGSMRRSARSPIASTPVRTASRPVALAGRVRAARARSSSTDRGRPDRGPFPVELGVEVHPQQLDGNQAPGRCWLPAYLAQWNGPSVVLPDEEAADLFHTEEARRLPRPAVRGVGLETIPLRYGHTYEMRVRLTDPTGGGPHEDDGPITRRLRRSPRCPSAATSCRSRFAWSTRRRSRRPPAGPATRTLRVSPVTCCTSIGRASAIPASCSPASTRTRCRCCRRRPIAAPWPGNRDSFGIPDPDVTQLRIDVEVRALTHGQPAVGRADGRRTRCSTRRRGRSPATSTPRRARLASATRPCCASVIRPTSATSA